MAPENRFERNRKSRLTLTAHEYAVMSAARSSGRSVCQCSTGKPQRRASRAIVAYTSHVEYGRPTRPRQNGPDADIRLTSGCFGSTSVYEQKEPNLYQTFRSLPRLCASLRLGD